MDSLSCNWGALFKKICATAANRQSICKLWHLEVNMNTFVCAAASWPHIRLRQPEINTGLTRISGCLARWALLWPGGRPRFSSCLEHRLCCNSAWTFPLKGGACARYHISQIRLGVMRFLYWRIHMVDYICSVSDPGSVRASTPAIRH